MTGDGQKFSVVPFPLYFFTGFKHRKKLRNTRESNQGQEYCAIEHITENGPRD